MSLIRTADYANASKKNKSLSISKQRGINPKIRLPTQHKSHKVFCRNCNKQNTQTAKICVQCDCTIKEPKLRRKMK